jgi:ribonucleoside-diphosphate reductase alpha chain
MEYLGRTDLVQIEPTPIDQTGEDAALQPGEDDMMHPTAQGVGPSPAQRIASPDAPVVPTIFTPKNRNGNGNGNGSGSHHYEPATEAVGTLKVEASATASPAPQASAAQPQQMSAIDQQLGEMMGDAPFCDICGHITVRNGSCYKCLNCGNSLGCS